MVETKGLKGVYNRVGLLSSIIKEDVYDVTMVTEKIQKNTFLPLMHIAYREATNKLMMTGKNLTKAELDHTLLSNSSIQLTKETYDMFKRVHRSEFNIVSNNIGEGHRHTANMIMLVSRADFFIKNGYDIMPHEYQIMIMNNGSIKV